MPMIDVYAPEGLFPEGSERALAEELTRSLITREGNPLVEPILSNTAAYLHVLPAGQVHTAASDRSRTVRVQVLTPPGVLDRAGQQGFVADATEIVTRLSGDPTQAGRTWVLLSEATEGGWGIAGTAFGRAEFAALGGG